MAIQKPQIRRYIATTQSKDEPYLIEIRNFLPDDMGALQFIESLSEFGTMTDSPNDVEIDKTMTQMKEFARRRGGLIADLINDKIADFEHIKEDAGFRRYMFAIRQCFDANEVCRYIESYRQEELLDAHQS